MISMDMVWSSTFGDIEKLEAASNALSQVFATVELAEHIFSFVLNRDLLVTSRGCSHFKTIISSSITLQRKLFLAPAGQDFQKSLCSKASCEAKHGRCLNPLLVDVMAAFPNNKTDVPGYAYNNDDPQDGVDYFTIFLYASFLDNYYKTSSEDMFLTQPPVKKIELEAYVNENGYTRRATGNLENEGGVRYGDMLRFARRKHENHRAIWPESSPSPRCYRFRPTCTGEGEVEMSG